MHKFFFNVIVSVFIKFKFFQSTSKSYSSLARNVAANKDIEAMKKLGEKLNLQVIVHRGFISYNKTKTILKDS